MKPSQNIKVVDVRQTYEDFCEANEAEVYRVFEDSHLGREAQAFKVKASGTLYVAYTEDSPHGKWLIRHTYAGVHKWLAFH